MRKLFLFIAAIAASSALWAQTQEMSYLYPVYNSAAPTSGIKEWKTGSADATAVENASETVTWNAGWYVVTGNITLSKGAVCQGAVHLILADGATLTAKGYYEFPTRVPGIRVSGNDNSLTVYAQSTGDQMGQLIASGGGNAAGIGGGYMEKGSNITINGGMVTATSDSYYGSGIGGGWEGDGFNIIVNGGTVTVNGGGSSAGIGGGYKGNGSGITINGGNVTATGGAGAAGIGGGATANGSNITINGGNVTANGGNNSAGIGGGRDGFGSNIKVATTHRVKADGANPPTTVIAKDRTDNTDIASQLAGKQYVKIEKITLDDIKAEAIAEINAAIEDVTAESVLAVANKAIEDINAATNKEDIKSIKEQALVDILAAIKDAAVAEIMTAGQGIQNENLNNWINAAIHDINAAETDTKEKVDDIKGQILDVIYFFLNGKAEGDAAGYQRAKDELPTDAQDAAGHTVIITKGDKTLKLVNPEKVEFGKQ